MLNILYLVLSENIVNVELVDSGYRSYTFKFTINKQIHIISSTFTLHSHTHSHLVIIITTLFW